MLQLEEPEETSTSIVDNHEDVNSDDTVLDHPLQTTSDGGQFPSSTVNVVIHPSSLDIVNSSAANLTNHPSISVATNSSTSSGFPDISTTTNSAIGDSSGEISATSNLKMLTSLAAQLANASTDTFIPNQGVQFEEVDLSRYTSEPAYTQADVEPNSQEEVLYSFQFVPCNDGDMVDGAQTGQPFNFDNLKLETFSSEDFEMKKVDIAQRVIKQENVKLEGFSNENVEITDTEDMKTTIQVGKTKKKRGPQKHNKRSDQPAKLPPLPLESELFDDPEPEVGRRKEKSLTLLAQKMLEMFPMQGMDLSQAIQLDQVAKYLGTQMGRLGVIVDVFEALHIMTKLEKNLYNWHGCSFLMPTLVWLRQISVELGVPEQYEFVKDKELEAILNNALKENNLEEESGSSSSSDETCCMSPKYNSKYCGSTSVGINTQLFLMLMLVAPDPKTVNLEFAASVMHGSSSIKKPNHIRRFLDVANILSCLGLVVKVRTATAQGVRNAFQYNGPQVVDDMEVDEVAKMAMPVSRQKNSVFPYPKSTGSCVKNVEMKKRGRKLGSKNKEKEADCETIEEGGNKKAIVQDVGGIKKRGRKPGQKKVKTAKDIVNEIVETLINEMLEIPENIVKKKQGRKPWLRKECTRVETDVDKKSKDKKRALSNDNSKLWWKKVKLCEYLKRVENNSVETDENVNEINVGGDKGKENNFKIIKPKKDRIIIGNDVVKNKSIEVDTKKLGKRKLFEKIEMIHTGEDNEDGVQIRLDLEKFDSVNSRKKKLPKVEIIQIDADEGDGIKETLDKVDNRGVKSRKITQIGVNDEESVKIGFDSCEKNGAKRRKVKVSKKMKIGQIRINEDDGIKSYQRKSSQKKEKKELRKDINENTNHVEHGIRKSRRLVECNERKDNLNDKVSNEKKKIVKLMNTGEGVNEESNSLKIKYDLTEANCYDLKC